MDGNIKGLIISFVFLLIIIIGTAFLAKNRIFSGDTTREIEYTGFTCWWIIAMTYFTRPQYPAIVSVSVAVILFVSHQMDIFRIPESSSHRNYGFMYFPLSLFVLSILCFGWKMPAYAGALGVFIMGFGSNFSALAGKTIGRHEFSVFGTKKSIEGTVVMLIVSFIVVFIILSKYNPSARIPRSFAMSAAATAVDALTPHGLDYLTVPISASLLFYFLFV